MPRHSPASVASFTISVNAAVSRVGWQRQGLIKAADPAARTSHWRAYPDLPPTSGLRIKRDSAAIWGGLKAFRGCSWAWPAAPAIPTKREGTWFRRFSLCDLLSPAEVHDAEAAGRAMRSGARCCGSSADETARHPTLIRPGTSCCENLASSATRPDLLRRKSPDPASRPSPRTVLGSNRSSKPGG